MVVGAPLRFFNSLGRRVVDFQPLVPGRVRIYSCGPTVYYYPHLGNLRPYVFADTLRRLLSWKGYQVDHVINITDVGHTLGDNDAAEDKVEVAARRELRSVEELTAHYTQAFFDDLAALGVRSATHYPVASAYVPQMIEFSRVLEEKGFTYRLESGLYFDTAKARDYGRLALLPRTDDPEHVRMEAVAGKRSPADFAVWRSDAPGERRVMRWDSPWGPGVPGWHLECSVMSMVLLGEHFDIHTGGVDHREIHHVNEIAQSEAYLGEPRDWVPLWMHNEFLLFGREKMSKSSGPMPVLGDLTKDGLHPLAYRYFLLTAHYRSQLDFTVGAIDAAATAYRRLLVRVAPLRPLPAPATLGEALDQLGAEGLAALSRIDEAISDDLNTPRVLAELQAVLRDEPIPERDRALIVGSVEQLLGLGLDRTSADEVVDRSAGLAVSAEHIEELVEARRVARQERRWSDADRLRHELRELGVDVADTATGTRWSVVARPE